MGRGPPRLSINLTEDEQAELAAIASSRQMSDELKKRAKIILLTEGGVTISETANLLGIGVVTVGFWRKRFYSKRVAGLLSHRKSGRPRKHTDDEVVELLEMLPQIADRAPHWSRRDLNKANGMSIFAVRRYLPLMGVQSSAARGFQLTSNSVLVEKLDKVTGLYLSPRCKVIALCLYLDDSDRRLKRAQVATGAGTGLSTGAHDARSDAHALRLFEALDAANKQLFMRNRDGDFIQSLIVFLKRVDADVPAHLNVHLIFDEQGSHLHSQIRGWLAAKPRFHVHSTPSSSSWLKQAERWVGLVAQPAIRRKVVDIGRHLKREILRFIDDYDRHPRPFIWNACADSFKSED